MYVVSRAIARARIFSARHGWLRWSIVALTAAAAGIATHQQLATVEAERDAWGASVEVLVADGDLVPNGAIAVDARHLPAAMVPDAALSSLPAGARLRQRVTAGEILTAADLTAAPGPASSAAPGTAVVPIVDPLVRAVSVGLDVRVSSEGVVIAAEATIVGLVDDVVFIAVPDSDAPTVAAAAQAGLASLIFLP